MKIYIPLWNDPVNPWRPVEAEDLGGNRYRITEKQPANEEWPFATGEIVTCKLRRFPDGLEALIVTLDAD